jgi:hypothetical protein
MTGLHAILPRLLLLALLPWAGRAGTVFVNNQMGDDARDGAAAEQAVRSLKRAVALCKPGDTLRLANTGEVYRESLRFGTRGGTPSAPIVVEGQGAVLSGLRPIPPAAWEDRGEGLFFHANGMRRSMGASRPFLVSDGKMVPQRRKPTGLGVGESCWNKDGIYFRAAPGKTAADYQLGGTMLVSGLILTGGSYIEVRDLVCENFANDGFNVHGSCQGLVFRDIVGRWNGDDGFSVHEDVGAVVLGGHFHHNNYGIQDISISRSSFYGVLVEQNRVAGADFVGGHHVLIDSVVRNNAGPQIQTRGDATRNIREPENPVARGALVLSNVLTVGGRQGLNVLNGVADVANCSFVGAEEGVRIGAQATVEMRESVVLGCKTLELACVSKTSRFTANAYFPGRMQSGSQAFAPAEFDAYQETSGQDTGSAVLPEPSFARKDSYRLLLPMLIAGKRQVRPGVARELSFPFGEPVVNPSAGRGATGPAVLAFDFESINPWGRIYPTPEKTKAGQPVVGKAELSTEQSHSGKQSMKLDVAFPAGRPGAWLVKLFSMKFPVEQPVVELRFALFGDGSGLAYTPRLRDRSGECFYGPAGKVDWEGWREIIWDLRKTPPVSIAAGDGNRKQDLPTLEVVLELMPKVPAEGSRMVLFVDDLKIRLAE